MLIFCGTFKLKFITFNIGLIFCMLPACRFTSSEGHQQTLEIRSGENLAKSYCGSCHMMPEPSLLTKKMWEKVLPHMGSRLGLSTLKYPYDGKSMMEMHRMKTAAVFPDEPTMSDSSWNRLTEYFYQNAPDTIDLQIPDKGKKVSLFKASFPMVNLSGYPVITMAKIDEKDKTVYLADGNGYLVILDSAFSLKEHGRVHSPIIQVQANYAGKLSALCIGRLFPNDEQTGAFITLDKKINNPQVLLTGLSRPVFFLQKDLDGDGLEDFVICGFGNYLGRLSLFRIKNGRYEETVLKAVPGATKVVALDVDEDSDQDLIALFAQGDEGISIFYNNNGYFKEKRVLRFHPLFGINDFQMVDMNGDNYLDIVLTNGDNGDFSNFLKPYHGVRVFVNSGSYEFEEQFFYPLPGASQVRSCDYDLDEDQDILVSSFFPDFENGLDRSVIYLQNDGSMKFRPSYLPEGSLGRWMVMDAGDLDNDGDTDVILGSFLLGSETIPDGLLKQWRKEGKHILFLENLTIDN